MIVTSSGFAGLREKELVNTFHKPYVAHSCAHESSIVNAGSRHSNYFEAKSAISNATNASSTVMVI